MKKILLNSLICTLLVPLFGQINTFPYHQDFESFLACQATCPSVCNLSAGWVNEQNDDTDWIVFSGTTPSAGTGPSHDYDPGINQGKYLYIEASEGCNRGTEAYLLTPAFDLSGLSLPVLEFAWHMLGEGMGQLHLDADTSNGWISDILPPIQGNSQEWNRQHVCLSDFAGSSWIRFRIRGVTGLTEQSDMAIDAFHLGEAPTIDVYLKGIEVEGCGQRGQAPVTLLLGNLGRRPVLGVNVSFAVDGGSFSAPEFVPDSLLSCGLLAFTLQAPADLSAPGRHVITAVVSLPGGIDQDSQNDTLRVWVESTPLIQNFPYEEGFEHDAGGWRAYGVNDSWEWGSPAGQYISSAGEGSKAWVTNLSGSYHNNEYSFLESPCLDFSSFNVDPVLSFLHTFQTEDELDLGWVEYSTDGGKRWQVLGNHGTGLENGYNNRWQEAWTGISSPQGGWRPAAMRLTGLAGKLVRIRFVMFADGSIQEEGFGVDRIRIVYPRDAAVAAILAPGDTCGATRGSRERVQILLKNQGYYELSNISVTFRVDGTGPFVPNEVIPGPIAGGASFSYVFQSRADLSTMGPHHIAAAVVLSGDNDFSNNLLVKSAGNFPFPQFNLGVDTVICGGDSITLEPGINGASFLWSNGATTPTLSVGGGGLYVLELTDVHGCRGRDSIVVTSLPALTTSFEYLEDARCYGDSSGTFKLKASGGVPPYSWQWHTGHTTGNLSRIPAGTYHFSLLDDFGCELRDSVVVGQPDSLLIVTDAIRNAGCPVDSSGFIHISVKGGTTPYAYLWSNGRVSEDLDRIPEGKYTLSLIDAHGCTVLSETYEITTQDTLPSARFNFVISGATVSFVDSSVNAVNYVWNFGDGSPAVNRVNPVYTYQENGSYQVLLIATNSCGQDTFVQTIQLNSVSIDPGTEGDMLKVFPNPVAAGGLLFLEGDGQPWEDAVLRFYSPAGKVIFQQNRDFLPPYFRQEISLPSSLPAGLYLLVLQSRRGTLQRRILLR